MGTFSMLLRILIGVLTPIFSFVLIFPIFAHLFLWTNRFLSRLQTFFYLYDKNAFLNFFPNVYYIYIKGHPYHENFIH